MVTGAVFSALLAVQAFEFVTRLLGLRAAWIVARIAALGRTGEPTLEGLELFRCRCLAVNRAVERPTDATQESLTTLHVRRVLLFAGTRRGGAQRAGDPTRDTLRIEFSEIARDLAALVERAEPLGDFTEADLKHARIKLGSFARGALQLVEDRREAIKQARANGVDEEKVAPAQELLSKARVAHAKEELDAATARRAWRLSLRRVPRSRRAPRSRRGPGARRVPRASSSSRRGRTRIPTRRRVRNGGTWRRP